MPLVSAKCTNCGANLEVDDTKDAAICPYCGTPYIVEKAINNFTVTNNIKADVVNIVNQVNPNNSADEMYKTCLECCRRREYEAMGYTLTKFRKEYPTDYRVYYIELLQYSNNFTYINEEKKFNIGTLEHVTSLYNQIKKWAPPNELNRITNEYNPYISKLRQAIQTKQDEEDAEKRIKEEERRKKCLLYN